MGTLFLIHQRYVYKGHQRYGMVTLASLVCLCIGIIALCDELGSSTIILFLGACYNYFDVIIIDMQPDM